MDERNVGRGMLLVAWFSILSLLVGAGLGAATKIVFWMFLGMIDLVWEKLPEQLNVDPTSMPYLAGALALGGLLVGLGNKYLGYHPEALETVMGRVKAGGTIDHSTIPQTLLNSLASLGFGGPLGPEAALVATIGGAYYWAKSGLESTAVSAYSSITGAVEGRALPLWKWAPSVVVAIGVVVGFRVLPGGIDTSFVPSTSLALGPMIALSVGIGLIGGLLGVLTSHVGAKVRSFKLFASRPLFTGILGGLAVAALAVRSSLVLFSGSEQMSAIFDGSTDNGQLLYSAGGKWIALMVVLAMGWKGGPVFPLMFVTGASAVALANLWGADSVVVYAAAIAASVAGTLGSAILGVAVALLVVPTSLIVPMFVGAVSAGVVVRVGNRRMRTKQAS